MQRGSVTAQDMFKAAQRPAGWLLSAERLRDAAEAILKDEIQYEIPYFRAHEAAVQEALAIACSEGNESGSAEIAARPPNYPAAQLLYAYAIENVLKGLIVANDPTLIKGDRLNSALNSHQLADLAKTAGLDVYVQEVPVLKALSTLSVWAGRYPVALNPFEYVGASNSNELLDYGSQNPIMRMFFDRAMKLLSGKLANPIANQFEVVVVFRPFGT